MSYDTGRDGPMAHLPNLGSNAGVLIRKDVIAAKEHSRSRSPNRLNDTDMSIGSSLNPNLKKAKEDRLMYQKRFLNGEEGSGSDQEEDEESKAQTKSKTVVMHFKRKAKAKAVDHNELRKRRAGRVNLDQSDDDRLDEYSEEGSSYTESEEDEYGNRRRVRRKRISRRSERRLYIPGR